MAIRKVSQDILTGTHHVGAGAVSGEARCFLSFGKEGTPGRVLKLEFKGDDADVDVNNTIQLLDRDGRQLLAALATDGGTDDSTVLNTDQEVVVGKTVTAVSTFGVGYYLSPNEADIYDESGDAQANTEGTVAGVVAVSPVTAVLASGTDGDWHRVTLWVEV